MKKKWYLMLTCVSITLPISLVSCGKTDEPVKPSKPFPIISPNPRDGVVTHPDKLTEVGHDEEIPTQDNKTQQIQPKKSANSNELEKEINIYKQNNREVLNTTFENISPLDEIKVKIAINEYYMLSIEAQTQLVQVKTLLDELQKQIYKLAGDAIEKEITKYKNDNQSIFTGLINNGWNNDFINIWNLTAVKYALNAYNNLSINAKTKLTQEKILLNQLLLKIENLIQDEINKYKNRYVNILNKTIENINLNDSWEVSQAISKHRGLHSVVKEKLQTEFEHLEKLQKEIWNLETAEYYKEQHKVILSKDINNITLDDETKWKEAYDDYDRSNDSVKAKLETENNHLQDLKRKMNILLDEFVETASTRYKNDYSAILVKDVNAITIHDESDLVNTINAYYKLREEVQLKLETEFNNLENLWIKIWRIKDGNNSNQDTEYKKGDHKNIDALNAYINGGYSWELLSATYAKYSRLLDKPELLKKYVDLTAYNNWDKLWYDLRMIALKIPRSTSELNIPFGKMILLMHIDVNRMIRIGANIKKYWSEGYKPSNIPSALWVNEKGELESYVFTPPINNSDKVEDKTLFDFIREINASEAKANFYQLKELKEIFWDFQ